MQCYNIVEHFRDEVVDSKYTKAITEQSKSLHGKAMNVTSNNSMVIPCVELNGCTRSRL